MKILALIVAVLLWVLPHGIAVNLLALIFGVFLIAVLIRVFAWLWRQI